METLLKLVSQQNVQFWFKFLKIGSKVCIFTIREQNYETKINWKGLMIYRKSFIMSAGKGFERKYFSANLVAAFFFYEFSGSKIKT